MDFYRKVTPKTNSLFTKEKPNMGVILEQSRKMREERNKEQQVALEKAQTEMARAKKEKDIANASRIKLESYKRNMVVKLHQYIPLCIMTECFNRIVSRALPHDEDYIEDISPRLEMFSKVYLHHLGGYKYLKETALKSKNQFLMKWYKVVKENSEDIIKDKLDMIQDAETEDDVSKIVKGGISADQAEKIDNDIEDLSVDDIAELVQNKVLDVVKDESERQAKDAALRQELSQRAKEYEDQNNEDQTNTVAENFKLGKFLLDPQILHETTLFYSMMYATQSEMIRALKEDASDTETVVPPRVPQKVLTSPLNLNLFDVYLNDYQNDLRDIDSLNVASRKPIAGDETRIDSEDVLAEALVKYTLLETAMTIRLINPDSKEVRAVAEYNMKYANRK